MSSNSPLAPPAAFGLRAASVVTPSGVLRDATVFVAGEHADVGGRITAVAPARSGHTTLPDSAVVDLRDRGATFLVPGFVDLHCHGGGGASFLTDDPTQLAKAVRFHREHGSTTVVASLVTAPESVLTAACSALGPLARTGEIAGIHLEGPWLSQLRCGAQDPRYLRAPDPAEYSRLWEASRGSIVQVTIAPELPGAMTLIDEVVASGAVAAIGHTDASAETVRAAVDRGATLATHLCNGMAPLHHREPGCALSLWDDERVTLEIINDEHHLDPRLVRQIVRSAGMDRVAFITDAIAAAGAADGTYLLGDRAVIATAGVVRLAVPDGVGPLAGSTLTMDRAFANAIRQGHSPVAASHLTATTAARVLRKPELGAITVGRRADLVALNDRFEVVGVWRKGKELTLRPRNVVG